MNSRDHARPFGQTINALSRERRARAMLSALKAWSRWTNRGAPTVTQCFAMLRVAMNADSAVCSSCLLRSDSLAHSAEPFATTLGTMWGSGGNSGIDPALLGMAAGLAASRKRERIEDEQRRKLEADLAQIDRDYATIVVVYRRQDGSEASVTCTGLTYEEQLTRIADRGYTVLNVIK